MFYIKNRQAKPEAVTRKRNRAKVCVTALVMALASVPAFAEDAGKSVESPTFHLDTALGAMEANLPTLYPSSHAANLIVLKNGDVLCFWFSGTWEGDSGVGIVVSRLPKGSNTWQKTMLIDREDGKSYQNPAPFQDATGRLWLFHTSQTAGKGQADAQVLQVWSDDNGATWSKPKVIFTTPGSFTRQPMVVMDDGAWMLPIFYTPTEGITTGAESNYSTVKITADQGKSWRECRIPHSEGLVHPNVIKLAKQSYVVFLRSRFADWVYKATSSDGCKWTTPVPTVLPNNNASIQVTRLTNGHLVMAFNNSSGPENEHKPRTAPRLPLSVALSKDGGMTWTAVRDLETGDKGTMGKEHFPAREGKDEFSYPSVTQLPSGKILVAYTYRRVGIKVVEFPESWIEKSMTTGKFKANNH